MKYSESGWSAGTTEIDPGKNSSKRRSKNIFVKLICQSFYFLVSYLTSYCAADVFSQVITLTILRLNPVNMNIKLKIKSLFKICRNYNRCCGLVVRMVDCKSKVPGSDLGLDHYAVFLRKTLNSKCVSQSREWDIFKWVSKLTKDCFCFTYLCDWFRKALLPSCPIRNKPNTNHE